jgi:hypothetical protein
MAAGEMSSDQFRSFLSSICTNLLSYMVGGAVA